MRTRQQLKPFPGLTVLALAAIPFALFGRSGRALPIRPTDPERLAELLASTGEYCERAKAIALHFICIEKITEIENFFEKISSPSAIIRDEKIFTTRRIKRRTYTYDYQLVKKEVDFSERRILLEENGRKRNLENAGLPQLKYYSQYPFFGPVGFLSRYWQDHFKYSILGEETVNGERAVVIQAVPSEFREENFNVGRIWVNGASQIMRVEWEPDSIQNYEDEILSTPRGDFHKTVRWSVDYTIEKNGIRFPGRQLIQEIFYRDSPNSGIRQQAVKRETRFDYTNYKFFVVDTNVDIRDNRP